LYRVLRRRAGDAELVAAADQLSGEWRRELEALYAAAKREASGRAVGPTASQWGAVRGLAASGPDLADLRAALMGKDGVCRQGVSKDAWSREGYLGAKRCSFSNLLESWLSANAADGAVRVRALASLAGAAWGIDGIPTERAPE